jgi:hypothetical protein
MFRAFHGFSSFLKSLNLTDRKNRRCSTVFTILVKFLEETHLDLFHMFHGFRKFLIGTPPPNSFADSSTIAECLHAQTLTPGQAPYPKTDYQGLH